MTEKKLLKFLTVASLAIIPVSFSTYSLYATDKSVDISKLAIKDLDIKKLDL